MALLRLSRKNFTLNVIHFLVEIQSTSSSVFELSKDLTVNCTEEFLNISTISRVAVESCSDNFESKVHKGPGIRKPIFSKNQREYLISSCPDQPKLSVFPVDISI